MQNLPLVFKCKIRGHAINLNDDTQIPLQELTKICAITNLERAENIDSWNVIMDSRVLKITTGYYGAAYLSSEYKTLLIASSGTKFNFEKIWDIGLMQCAKSFVKDFANDIQIFSGYAPLQFYRGAFPFYKMVRKQLTEEYKVVFLGHSLGGIISELLLTKSFLDGEKNFAISFDSPGSRPIAEYFLQNEQMIPYLKKVCININNHHNWVNTLYEPLGSVFKISNSSETDAENILYKQMKLHQISAFSEIKEITQVDSWKTGLFFEDVKATINSCIEKLTKPFSCCINNILSYFKHSYNTITRYYCMDENLVIMDDLSYEDDYFDNDELRAT